jgi:hypothetical protein
MNFETVLKTAVAIVGAVLAFNLGRRLVSGVKLT